MKRILKKINNLESSLVFFDEEGNVTDHGNLSGDVSNMSGDVSYYLSGNVSNLSGNVSNLRGDVYDAEISEEERNKGIKVSDLIEE